MSETTNIRSISTMATWPVYNELVLFIRSLRAVHPNIPLLILTQHKVAQQLATDNLIDDHTTIIIGMEKFGLSSWKHKPTWYECHFLAHKSLAMKAALMKYPNTLFIDCDVLILASLPKVDETKDIGLQKMEPSYSDPKFRYTAGWIFVNHSRFPHQYWQAIHKVQDGDYWADQSSLATLTIFYSYFLFPISNHVYTLLFMRGRKCHLRLRQLKTQPVLSYRNKPIGAIHFHILQQPTADIRYIFLLYLLYKNHSPWFDYINNYPAYPHYNMTKLKRGCAFLFAMIIKNTASRKERLSAIGYKQHKYKKKDIRYHLIRIYKHLVLSYYLVLEILLFHRIIYKSEFAMPKWKLFIITFGRIYKLLGRRYEETIPLNQLR